MSLFNWLFHKKRTAEKAMKADSPSEAKVVIESSGVSSQGNSNRSIIKDGVKHVPITEMRPDILSEGDVVLAQSFIPAFCALGGLNSEKKYHQTIKEGQKMLGQTPNDPGVHINMMVAYFKIREEKPEYLDKCNYHAKMAILNGHDTGYAEDRLIKNLIKAKCYHQAIQLCDIVLHDDFHFSMHGMGNKEEYEDRKAKLLPKLSKAADTENDILFTKDEIMRVFQSIKDNRDREKRMKAESDERRRKMKEQVERIIRGEN